MPCCLVVLENGNGHPWLSRSARPDPSAQTGADSHPLQSEDAPTLKQSEAKRSVTPSLVLAIRCDGFDDGGSEARGAASERDAKMVELSARRVTALSDPLDCARGVTSSTRLEQGLLTRTRTLQILVESADMDGDVSTDQIKSAFASSRGAYMRMPPVAHRMPSSRLSSQVEVHRVTFELEA